MLRMPSKVEIKANGVGKQIWKKDEILFRSPEVGVHRFGRSGDSIAKENEITVIRNGLSPRVHIPSHRLQAAMHFLVLYQRRLGTAVDGGIRASWVAVVGGKASLSSLVGGYNVRSYIFVFAFISRRQDTSM